jgi:hypothetical protein
MFGEDEKKSIMFVLLALVLSVAVAVMSNIVAYIVPNGLA